MNELGTVRAPVGAPLTVLVGAALLALMQLYVAIPLAPVVGAELHGDAAAALGTAYALAYAGGFLVWGPLSDRYGRKVVLVPGMAAFAAATALLPLAESLLTVAILRAVQGFLAASFATVSLAYVGEALPPRWRSTGVGAITSAFLVAGIAGQVYAEAVALAAGWQWVFGVAAPLLALAALAMAVVLAEPPRPPGQVSLRRRFAELGGLLMRRDLTPVYAGCVTILLGFVAMYTALGPLLQDRFGLDGPDVLLVRLAGLPAMVLAPFAGWLAGRLGPARMAIAGYLVAAAGLALQAASTSALWALVVSSVVFVTGIVAVVPAVISLVGDRAGPSRGSALALNGLAVFLGASLGPLTPLLGLGFTGLLLFLAGLLVLAAGLIALIR